MRDEQINGIININKPAGMTSFDVIARLRRLLNTKKVGHTGTLDPDATGVLPVCIGKATKISELIMGKDKSYIAEITFGIETDTQDAQGKIVNKACNVEIDESQLKNVIKSFIGEYNQIPPMYSAIKINGRKLYELAREGKEIEREARTIYINNIEILDLNLKKEFPTAMIEVRCSKGTYIRTLCYDIGKLMGFGAHMSSLIRTGSGDFSLENSITLESLENEIENGNLNKILIHIDRLFNDLDYIKLTSKQVMLFNNGVQINAEGLNIHAENLDQLNTNSSKKDTYINNEDNEDNEDRLYRVYDDLNKFIALAKIQLKDSKKVLKKHKSF